MALFTANGLVAELEESWTDVTSVSFYLSYTYVILILGYTEGIQLRRLFERRTNLFGSESTGSSPGERESKYFKMYYRVYLFLALYSKFFYSLNIFVLFQLWACVAYVVQKFYAQLNIRVKSHRATRVLALFAIDFAVSSAIKKLTIAYNNGEE